jgi:CRP-like cAMP-binding protein
MKQTIVFFRTKLGNQILGVEYGSLGGDARRVLAMIDGRSTVREIMRKVPHSVQVQLDQIFTQLLSSGLIRVKANPASADVVVSRDDDDGVITQKLEKVEPAKVIDSYSESVDPKAKQILELEFELADVRERLSVSRVRQHELEQTCQKLEQRVAEYEREYGAIADTTMPNEERPGEAYDTLDFMGTWNQTLLDQKAALETTIKLESFKEQSIAPKQKFGDHAVAPPHANPHYRKLRGLEFFKSFTNADLLEFLDHVEWQTVIAGDAILQEGESGLFYFIIVSGAVTVTRKSRMMASLSVGDFFGEFAYLSGNVPLRTARVVAESDCELLKVEPLEIESASLQIRLQVVEALLRGLAKRSLMSSHRIDSMLNHLDMGRSTHDSF